LFFFFSPSFFFDFFLFLADQVSKMFSFLSFHFPFSNFLFNQVYKRTFNGLPLNRKKKQTEKGKQKDSIENHPKHRIQTKRKKRKK